MTLRCVIYNRISSAKQTPYATGMSLNAQKYICVNFAQMNNMKVTKVYKEVYSAFKRMPRILSKVIKLRNSNILITDVSRFSRSVVIGIDLARAAIKNRNKLIFINDNFVCSKLSQLGDLARRLAQSEQESVNIGIRVKNSKRYLGALGLYSGGFIPYGYVVDGRKIIKSVLEQKIIKFISACRQPNIIAATLNKLMRDITNITRNKKPNKEPNIKTGKNNTKQYVPILCYDESGCKVLKITEILTYKEIADILNSYMVRKRTLKWTASSVKNVAIKNSGNRQSDHPNTSTPAAAPSTTPSTTHSPTITAKKRKPIIYENMYKKNKIDIIVDSDNLPKPIILEPHVYATVTNLYLLEQFIKFRELMTV